MALSKKPYKGCRDFFPTQMRVRNFLFDKMKRVAKSYAYEAYDGPLLEETALYKAKSGEELINDQIYSFTDRGEREVAIRPEMTPTLARMVANVHKELSKPIRWYSIPNLMRYEKPQRGRVREHWQFNVDIFGAPENLGESEILSFITDFLESFGATNKMFSILINDRQIVDSIFNKLLQLSEPDAHKLYKVIDRAKKVSPEKLDQMISEILKAPKAIEKFKSYLKLASFEELKLFLDENELTKDCERFLNFINLIKETHYYSYLKFDPTIVRGLDYYTGIVFEVFDMHPENNRAIAGGGSYANLLQIFNESPLAGVGFGLGDVTLKDFLESHKLLPDFNKAESDVLIVYTEDTLSIDAIQLAEKLREKLNVECHLGRVKFNKIIKLAENKGHSFVLIIEKRDEVLSIQLKDLVKKTSMQVEHGGISEILKLIKDKA